MPKTGKYLYDKNMEKVLLSSGLTSLLMTMKHKLKNITSKLLSVADLSFSKSFISLDFGVKSKFL
jgi:hypothetical protein